MNGRRYSAPPSLCGIQSRSIFTIWRQDSRNSSYGSGAIASRSAESRKRFAFMSARNIDAPPICQR